MRLPALVASVRHPATGIANLLVSPFAYGRATAKINGESRRFPTRATIHLPLCLPVANKFVNKAATSDQSLNFGAMM